MLIQEKRIVRDWLARHTRAQVQREHLKAALEAAKGNKSEAARLMGMTRRSIYLGLARSR